MHFAPYSPREQGTASEKHLKTLKSGLLLIFFGFDERDVARESKGEAKSQEGCFQAKARGIHIGI